MKRTVLGQSKIPSWLLPGCIALVLLAVDVSGTQSVLLAPVERVLSPLQQSVYSARIRFQSVLEFTLSYQKMVERLGYLENKTAELSAEVAALEAVQKENETLRKMIENTDRTLESRVISVPIVSAAVPMLAAGTDQGLEPGMMVTVSNTLLGTVSSVSQGRAVVSLFERTRDSGVVATTPNGVQGVLLGTGSGVVFTHIPSSEAVEVGESLTTVGQEGIKRGLLLGVLSQDLTNQEDAFQTFRVDQFVSFYSAPLVEVWKE